MKDDAVMLPNVSHPGRQAVEASKIVHRLRGLAVKLRRINLGADVRPHW